MTVVLGTALRNPGRDPSRYFRRLVTNPWQFDPIFSFRLAGNEAEGRSAVLSNQDRGQSNKKRDESPFPETPSPVTATTSPSRHHMTMQHQAGFIIPSLAEIDGLSAFAVAALPRASKRSKGATFAVYPEDDSADEADGLLLGLDDDKPKKKLGRKPANTEPANKR
ncbi:hypothetical protein BC830DRAFT_463444 [Chytriomyces sp. MP71]|nr:hypothetical protein BC830DRAFT_463444 [Chytriomyces sp. MP71]